MPTERNDGGGRPGPAAAQAGFVLIAVLSVTALLALMLGGATLLSRGSVETALVETDGLRETSLLASGVELAGHQLFVLRVDPASLNGQQLRLNDGTVTIFVSSEAGKVDLNGADTVLLAAAYRAAGLTALTPESFAARVLDWRDADETRSPDGAESADYQAAGLAYAPPNAPFRAIGDLRWVLGLSEPEVAAIAPYLTVSNPAGRVDPVFAAPSLLIALPGLGSGTLDALAQVSGRQGTDRIFHLRSIFRGLESHLILGEASRVFAVRVEARRTAGGPVRTVEAVLIAPVVSDRPYQVTQWREA